MIKKIVQCLLLTAGIVFFQSEKSFSQSDSSLKKKISFSLYNFNYLRDYEYFSPIMEGYTLYGGIVHPSLEFRRTEHVLFRAGLFTQEDFGEDSLRIRPTFLLRLEKNSHEYRTRTEFNFGNYRSDGYDLIEPLYFTDNLITENIDNGFLMRQHFTHLKITQWLDWERAIQKGSDFQEKVWGGASVDYIGYFSRFRNNQLHIPVQIYVQHTGGQITQPDTSFYVQTLINGAAGFKYENSAITIHTPRIGFSVYRVYYKDFSPNPNSIFYDGTGTWVSIFSRINLEFGSNGNKNPDNLKLIVSYWQGENFISPKGNPLMQSISSVFPESDYIENERQLLFFTAKYENTIDKNVSLVLSAEPYYDLKNKLLEYGIHLHLKFLFYEDEEFFAEQLFSPKKISGSPRF